MPHTLKTRCTQVEESLVDKVALKTLSIGLEGRLGSIARSVTKLLIIVVRNGKMPFFF